MIEFIIFLVIVVLYWIFFGPMILNSFRMHNIMNNTDKNKESPNA